MTNKKKRTEKQQKEYDRKRRQKHHRSFRGHALKLYNAMLFRVKHKDVYIRRNVKVQIERADFLDWILNDRKYKRLYRKWVNENYNHLFAPSIDRIDSFGNYSFSNIQLMTHYENIKKSKADGSRAKSKRRKGFKK